MRALRIGLWTLLALALVLALLRTFFFGVYYVDSPSMEPTLHGAESGGDWVLVRYGRGGPLRRHDLLVIVPEGESEPYVKRVVGLPGESVAIRAGDLWIDTELHREPGGLAVPVVVFDAEHHAFDVDWRLGERWSSTEDGWELDGTGVPAGAAAGLAFLRLGLSDHHDLPNGDRVEGRVDVADGRLEFSFEVLEGDFVLRAGLRERGDEFELRLEPAPGGRALARLLRRSPEGQEELDQVELALGPGPHRVGFENVADVLAVDLDGVRRLEHAYDGNHFHPRDTAKSGMSLPTDRVFLGGRGGRARFREVRVLRDLHYTSRGAFGVEEAVTLGPQEVFLLGDNSRDSRDGRDWGPTPLSTVVGRPTLVVWPPERFRSLSRAVEAPPEGAATAVAPTPDSP